MLFAFCSNEVVVDESEPLVTTEVVVNTTTVFDEFVAVHLVEKHNINLRQRRLRARSEQAV